MEKELEVKLSQEAKLAEVARSLGDIEHEVKNLLMPVVTGTGLIEGELNNLFSQLPEQKPEKLKSSQSLCRKLPRC